MLDVPQDETIKRVSAIVARIAEQHDVKQGIGPSDSLVDRGLTSMAMVDLMLAVEAAFDVTIPRHEMTPANFESIESLARLLRRL